MKRIDEGRHIDLHQGALSGEAAQQWVEDVDIANPLMKADRDMPVHRPATEEAESPTYYDMPVVKAPPWIWYIPAYFYVGGAAGASAVLGAAVQVAAADGVGRRDLVLRCRWITTVGVLVGSGFLIADLGRPARFLNMLRVFRPTSPLNVGTWIIAFTGTASGVALVGRGPLRPIGDAAGVAAGVGGALLATYTAVVLTNTASPLWSRPRRSLPFLFAASAMASATSLLELVDDDPVIQRLDRGAKLLEVVGTQLVAREIGGGRVGRPLNEGKSGALWKAAKLLGYAGLAAALVPGRSWKKRAVAGVLGTAAAITLRTALHEAGMASFDDPRATFESQRA